MYSLPQVLHLDKLVASLLCAICAILRGMGKTSVPTVEVFRNRQRPRRRKRAPEHRIQFTFAAPWDQLLPCCLASLRVTQVEIRRDISYVSLISSPLVASKPKRVVENRPAPYRFSNRITINLLTEWLSSHANRCRRWAIDNSSFWENLKAVTDPPKAPYAFQWSLQDSRHPLI